MRPQAPRILSAVVKLSQKLDSLALREWNHKRVGEWVEAATAGDEYTQVYEQLNTILDKHWQDGFDFCLMDARPEERSPEGNRAF